MLSITAGGGTGVGGLMSEPPTPTGVMSTAQRWGEEVLRHVRIRCTTPVWLARPDGRMIAG
jgi:hypothetical protein